MSELVWEIEAFDNSKKKQKKGRSYLAEIHTSKAETSDIEITGYDNKAGAIYEFSCPVCKEQLRGAEHGWWKISCECGYYWNVNRCCATGTRDKYIYENGSIRDSVNRFF